MRHRSRRGVRGDVDHDDAELDPPLNLAVTANTYSHVLADEAELDYAELLA